MKCSSLSIAIVVLICLFKAPTLQGSSGHHQYFYEEDDLYADYSYDYPDRHGSAERPKDHSSAKENAIQKTGLKDAIKKVAHSKSEKDFYYLDEDEEYVDDTVSMSGTWSMASCSVWAFACKNLLPFLLVTVFFKPSIR